MNMPDMPEAMKKISDLATVIAGFSPRPVERKRKGEYLLIGGRNIKDGKLITTDADSYVDTIDRESFRRTVALPGDIIVSTLFDKRKLCVYRQGDPPAVINSSCAIIRSGAQSGYIASYLRTIEGQREFLHKATQATTHAVIPRLSTRDLADIQIPILPFPELERLSDASIETATSSELSALKKELESKDAEIAELKARHQESEEFLRDRIRAIEEQMDTNSLTARIRHGETAVLEFKSSLRWNIRASRVDKSMENAVLKTIAAFCNTNGGELLIGVADDGEILGVHHDNFPNADKFLLHLSNILTDRIRPETVEYVEYKMITLEGKAVCHVICKPSKRGLWLNGDGNQWLFYVRSGPSSKELPAPEAVEYLRDRFDPKE